MNGLVGGRYKVTWAIRSSLYANNDDDDDFDDNEMQTMMMMMMMKSFNQAALGQRHCCPL